MESINIKYPWPSNFKMLKTTIKKKTIFNFIIIRKESSLYKLKNILKLQKKNTVACESIQILQCGGERVNNICYNLRL